MNKYKFRAECAYDALRFIDSIPLKRKGEFKIEDDKESLPDVTVLISVESLTCNELIEIANNIEDCHVIAETLATEQQYTGVRAHHQ